jgi:hypothetical protein
MKKYLWVFVLISAFSFSAVHADVPATTGIIAGQIWYSEDPLVAGDTVKIYTAVWNGDSSPLSARVEFYDQNTVLGERDVVVDSQSLNDVSVSWLVTPGDHVIHATIISSSVTTGSKSQSVTLSRTSTADDAVSVPVTVQTSSGADVKSADLIGDEVATATSQITDAIPPSVTANFDSLDTIRSTTYAKIAASKADAQKQLDALNAVTPSQDATTAKSPAVTPQSTSSADPLASTQKPIAYIKLFFLTVLAFIFQYPVVFYALAIYLIFIILRFIYRKIKNR